MPSANGEPRAKSRPKRGIVESELVEAESENGLTLRQQQVLDHLRNGMSNKLIARALSLTEGTVKVHVRQIMRKFNATNRTEVAVASVRIHRAPAGSGELRVVEAVTIPRSAA